MKKVCIVYVALLVFLLLSCKARAADLSFTWDPAAGAASYKIQMSTDQGATWAVEKVVPSGTTYTWSGAPDSGLLLFRAVAVNAQGQAIRVESGAWFNGSWKLPAQPGGLGMK